MCDLVKHDALLCFSTALIGAFPSSLFHSVICSLCGPPPAIKECVLKGELPATSLIKLDLH